MGTADFRKAVEGWGIKTGEQLAALARQACFETASQVVTATPVDTGFLRGSWQPSIGAPINGGEIADQGAQAVSGLGILLADLKLGEVFHMTNGASYGAYVEFGTSRQEGQFFVRGVIDRFPEIVSEVAADLGFVRR